MGIKVFSMNNCAGCVTVKNILNSRGVEYTELDVNNVDNFEEAEKYRIRSLPTIVVTRGNNDIETITGASPRSLQLLNQSLVEGGF